MCNNKITKTFQIIILYRLDHASEILNLHNIASKLTTVEHATSQTLLDVTLALGQNLEQES